MERVGVGAGVGVGDGVVVGHVTHLQAVHAAVCVASAGLNEDKASLFSQQVVQRSLCPIRLFSIHMLSKL